MNGCHKPTTRWGTLCSTHRNRQRRHGHSNQTGVTKTELKPYVEIVRRRKARNQNNPLWTTLQTRWEQLVENARLVLKDYLNGKAMSRHLVMTSRELVNIHETVEFDDISSTALAMFILQTQHPMRFRDQSGFLHQLARRLRGLSDMNAGTWFDHSTGKVKRVYRDLPARTSQQFGQSALEVFALAGAVLAKKEIEEANAKQAEKLTIINAIQEMQ